MKAIVTICVIGFGFCHAFCQGSQQDKDNQAKKATSVNVEVLLEGRDEPFRKSPLLFVTAMGRFGNVDGGVLSDEAIQGYFQRPTRDKSKADYVRVDFYVPDETTLVVVTNALNKLRCSAEPGTENVILVRLDGLTWQKDGQEKKEPLNVKIILENPDDPVRECPSLFLSANGELKNEGGQVMADEAVQTYFRRSTRDSKKVDYVRLKISAPDKTMLTALTNALYKLRCSAAPGTENVILVRLDGLDCKKDKK